MKFRIPFIYQRLAYSAVEISLIDVIAPADLAARSAGPAPAHEARAWANLMAPRIDIEGAIPALSKHLLVGSGVTYRIVAPAITVPATATTPASYYEYRYFAPGKSGWEDGFPFGLFAEYTI